MITVAAIGINQALRNERGLVQEKLATDGDARPLAQLCTVDASVADEARLKVDRHLLYDQLELKPTDDRTLFDDRADVEAAPKVFDSRRNTFGTEILANRLPECGNQLALGEAAVALDIHPQNTQ